MTRLSPPLLVALVLPLLLAVVVAGIAIANRGVGDPSPETGPLPVPPVEVVAAQGPECAGLLSALPTELPGAEGPLPPRPIADPAPPAVRAWAAAPRPAVLRCGLPRPAELNPASALLVVNGVQWLELDDGVPDPVAVTYVAVDRPVYVVLTTPLDEGSGPLQAVSDVVRDTLPATEVAVR